METKIEEIWKDVVGYEGNYKVSNLGNIKSRNAIRKPLFMKRHGYYQINLCSNGKHKWFRLHRVVARSFIENPQNKPYINHIDGVKTNNVVSNLEWCTPSENMQHAYDAGLKVALFGENHGMAKISNDDVFEIRQLDTMYGLNKVVAAKEYNLTKARISQLTTGYIRKKRKAKDY